MVSSAIVLLFIGECTANIRLSLPYPNPNSNPNPNPDPNPNPYPNPNPIQGECTTNIRLSLDIKEGTEQGMQGRASTVLPAISEDEIERGGAGSGEDGGLAPLAPLTAVPELVEELRRMATLAGASACASEAVAAPLVGTEVGTDPMAPVDARAAPLD
jgi:hypothetical protein